jgi:beta-lactamase regulating signal transducer with metallopeptidase domain
MSALFETRALLFAGECLFASALLPVLAWASARLVARAGLRHFAWLTAFGVMLMLPVAALILPPQVVVRQEAAIVEDSPAIPDLIVPASDAAPALRETPPQASFAWPDLAVALAVLWALGAGFVAARSVFALACLGSLRRRSRPHALGHGDVPRIAYDGRECELRLSDADEGPITWGCFKPVILLPKASRFWSRERLHAVLLHELAHVRRRDSFSQALSLIACALYWPNPLVWRAARALRREAEIAADDAVIAWGMKPSAYAGELLELAAEFRTARPAAVSMASKTSLETRLKSVLAPNQSRRGVTTMDALKIACLGFAATAALAFLRPDIVAAQDTDNASVAAPLPPPPPPANLADVPPPPPPAEAPMPPAPPSDVEAPVPPSPPAPPHHVRVHMIRIDRDAHMSQADIDRVEAEARRAEVEVDKAISEAKIEQTVAAALAKEQPRIRAEVAQALAKARPAIRAALAEAHVSEKVARALAKAQPKIDAAIARARKEADEAERADRADDKVIDDESGDNDDEH